MRKLIAILLMLILMIGVVGCAKKLEEKAEVMLPICLQDDNGVKGELNWIVGGNEDIIVVRGFIRNENNRIAFEYEKNINSGRTVFRETDYKEEQLLYEIGSIDITDTAVFSVGEMIVMHRQEGGIYHAGPTDTNSVVCHTLRSDIDFKYDGNGNCIQFMEKGISTIVISEDIDLLKANSNLSMEQREVLEDNAQNVFFELVHVIRHIYN